MPVGVCAAVALGDCGGEVASMEALTEPVCVLGLGVPLLLDVGLALVVAAELGELVLKVVGRAEPLLVPEGVGTAVPVDVEVLVAVGVTVEVPVADEVLVGVPELVNVALALDVRVSGVDLLDVAEDVGGAVDIAVTELVLLGATDPVWLPLGLGVPLGLALDVPEELGVPVMVGAGEPEQL